MAGQGSPPPPSLTSCCFFHRLVTRILAPKQWGEKAPLPSLRHRMASMAGTQRAVLLPFAQTLLLQNVSVGMRGQEGGDPGTCIVPLCTSPHCVLPAPCRVAVCAEASGRSVGREHPRGVVRGAAVSVRMQAHEQESRMPPPDPGEAGPSETRSEVSAGAW